MIFFFTSFYGYFTTLNSNLKGNILRFSENIKAFISSYYKKIYDMLALKNCLLSEISKSLNEKIPLRKTVNRLSGNLNAFDNAAELFEVYMTDEKDSPG